MLYQYKTTPPPTVEAAPVADLITNTASGWKLLPTWFVEDYELGRFVITTAKIIVTSKTTAVGPNLDACIGDYLVRDVYGNYSVMSTDTFNAMFTPLST